MDYTEEPIAEVDEPPDERRRRSPWTPPEFRPAFGKAEPAINDRRESLLTRQLHSETDHTDEEESKRTRTPPPRTMSTQSTWSNPSVASTAELTSDDGHSIASSAVSPPLPPTAITVSIPRSIADKVLTREPSIVVHIAKEANLAPEEKSVEEGLGRKRCISFACGNKKTPAPPALVPAKEPDTKASSPPKRKCMLKFACPTRPGSEIKAERPATVSRRTMSPPPPQRKPSARGEAIKVHRGSDSTVTHGSPKLIRKSSVMSNVDSTPATPRPTVTRKMSNDSDRSTEATRFHEFASSDDEPEEWVLESTCHRSRLTINDTLQKEIVLRRACEEVEEEAIDEEEEEDELDDEAELDDDEDEDDDELEESDDGFHTDDEEGFAESDSEGEDSDEDWWRPGGMSTAATSIEQHMDRLTLTRPESDAVPSSVESISPARHVEPPRMIRPRPERKQHRENNMPMRPRKEAMDLPDSTDFVCGTLDEDRPLEQAYLNHIKQREAAKHKARPQDIDPTFPTSDPEMDEEDDEDLEDAEESDDENMMHGNIDELDGDSTVRRRSTTHRSPPPPARRRSPAPPKRQGTARSPPPPPRHRSPAPTMKRQGTARSPPPAARHRSPAPALRKTATAPVVPRTRSPAPIALNRNLTGRASPSRMLFNAHRDRSPLVQGMRFTSPPNTRRSSPVASDANTSMPHVLASRPQLTHTASLPRGGGFTLGKPHTLRQEDGHAFDTASPSNARDLPKRGAIDIFKGLERKRQRRKEKLYQKACAKAAAKGDKAYKVKPGRGAERMREVGLELQRYHGKGEHILSL